jgi:DUF971 family protein
VVQPRDIAHSPTRNLLQVTWSDGTIDELAAPYLRAWCPCASCQGHGNVAAYHRADDDVRIEALTEIGAYALGIRFSDGHDSGIYTWEWLEKISPSRPPAGPKRGSFVAGHYRPPESGGAS